MADNRITTEDLLTIAETPFPENLDYIKASIHPKIRSEFPPGSQSSRISCADYDTVYVTSDIHSDLPKFVQMLQSLNLVSSASPIMNYEMNTELIYNPALISGIQWTGGARTLFVIVGDLVDGKRGELDGIEYSVNDPKGTYELLLFLLLHNLRIEARKVNSDIRYTMGNHEIDSCVLMKEKFWRDYVTNEAKQFFRTPADRSSVLVPFLQASPSVILRMFNGETPELICIHGALHDHDDGNDNTVALELMQDTLDTRPDLFTELLKTTEVHSATWSRFYKNTDPKVCTVLQASKYPLTIVGHCPTIRASRSKRILARESHAHCDTGDEEEDEKEDDGTMKIGCIVADCKNRTVKGDPPTLAMVDTGLSAGFRMDPKNNPGRDVEVLKLTHSTSREPTRYYNLIEATTGKRSRVIYEADIVPAKFNNFRNAPSVRTSKKRLNLNMTPNVNDKVAFAPRRTMKRSRLPNAPNKPSPLPNARNEPSPLPNVPSGSPVPNAPSGNTQTRDPSRASSFSGNNDLPPENGDPSPRVGGKRRRSWRYKRTRKSRK